jgi:threonine dehydratase
MTWSQALSESTGATVFLKNEHFQHTGSFKLRGALNKVLSLSSREKEKGVIAASTGNHGLGVAYAARIAGVPAAIYVPETASPIKVRGIAALGAEVRLVSGDCLEAELTAKKVAATQDQVFISPYNDIDVIAGQGTLGKEMLEQVSDLDAVFVSVGGGGLISGIAGYLKAMKPNVTIVGCWPKNSPILLEWIKAGRAIDVPEFPTLSDATSGSPETDTITFPYCQKWIDETVVVSEEEIGDSIRLIAESESSMIEGSAAVAVASLIRAGKAFRGKRVGVLLCGRNIDFGKFRSLIAPSH